MTHAHRLLAAAAMALLPALASAQNVLDIEQNAGGTPYSQTTPRAFQTFTTTASNLSGGGFFVNTFEAGLSPITISLVQDWLSATPTVLASSVATLPASGTTGWVDAFWTPVGVVAGAQYALQLSAGTSSYGAPYSIVYASGENPYADGQAYYQYDDGSFFSSAQYDLQFRTYTATTMSAVPEPSTWALMGTGLLTIGGVAVRRRRAAA